MYDYTDEKSVRMAGTTIRHPTLRAQGTLGPGSGNGSAPLPDCTSESMAILQLPDNSHGALAHRQTYAASCVAESKIPKEMSPSLLLQPWPG